VLSSPPAGVAGEGSGLLLSTRQEQLDALAALLAASDADLAEEGEEDGDDLANLKKKWGAASLVVRCRLPVWLGGGGGGRRAG
jgi:hypothetical protein